MRISADSIVLTVDHSGAFLAVPLATVRRLELSRGRRRNIRRGVFAGGVAVGSIGLLIGLAGTTTDCSGWLDFSPCEFGVGEVVAVTALAAAAGAVWGGLIGSALGETWRPIPLDRSRLTPIATPDGRLGIAATVGF